MAGQFLMAMFVKTKEVEVVPECWVTEDEGKKYCYWPNYSKLKAIYDAAKVKEIPNRKVWKRLAVRIFHSFDTYEEAMAEIPHFLKYSDYETATFSSKGKNKVVKATAAVLDGSDSDSDSSLCAIALNYTLSPVSLPEPPKIASTPKSRKNSLTSTPSSMLLSRQTLPSLEPYQPVATTSKSVMQGSTGTPVDVSGNGSTEYQYLAHELKEMKILCARGFASLKLQQDVLIAAVEGLASANISGSGGRRGDPKTNFGFPFKEVASFMEFEDKIKADENFCENAKVFLGRAGGSDLVEVVNNIFRKLMKDEVCEKFTLYGTALKGSFSKLETYELIADSVRVCGITKNATEVEIKNAVMSWLTHARDRIKSRQKSLGRKSVREAECH